MLDSSFLDIFLNKKKKLIILFTSVFLISIIFFCARVHTGTCAEKPNGSVKMRISQ